MSHISTFKDAGLDSPDLLAAFSSDAAESRRLAMTGAIMTHASTSFLEQCQTLFMESIQQQKKAGSTTDEDDDDDNHPEEEEPFSDVPEDEWFHCLRVLGWIRPSGLLEQALGTALHETVHQWVQEQIVTDFETEGLYDQVQESCNSVIVPWLHKLLGSEAFEQHQWDSRLNFCTAECFCLVRMEELFDLVAEYPDSHVGVVELRQVLEITYMHPKVGGALRSALVKRLNHPGANTSQIIDVYINTIKVLREIDPSDRLLQLVAEPVRSYLRSRKDTVRCIITSLTDAEMGGDLYEELRRQDARPLEQNQDDSDDEDEPPTLDWQPPPPISQPKGTFLGTGTQGGGGDILSMLVSIYGSKELFVNEYRAMLADKLLGNLDFDTDKEVLILELLKLRFGEMSMRNCEIMIKDIDDSKRIITNIHETIKTKQQTQETPMVDAAIVSHIFWPALQKDSVQHHPRIQSELDQFSTEYGHLKNPRRLVWMGQLGTVQLELDVVEDQDDGTQRIETREFSCGPLLATLISHFEDRDRWTAEDLSNETGIPEHVIQKRITYWVSNRVLVQQGNQYVIATCEHLCDHDAAATGMMDDHNTDGMAVSSSAQEEQEMEAYESYINGMLTNMGQLSLDRIHNMLKMFVTGSDIQYNKTPAQLAVFLQQLVKQEKLECGPDGMYKLVKK